MACAFKELAGLSVTIDKVVYMPHLEAPADRPYPFVYFITIDNQSDETVTIKGRKWVVTNSEGEITAVEGEGVVGETPEIPSGGSFSYNSFHLLDTPTAIAQGSYLGVDGCGRTVLTRIPKFEMAAPSQKA